MKKPLLTVFLLMCLAAGLPVKAERSLFPAGSVKLLESPFLTAQKTDIAYLLSLDVDRLTAPFYREAGLKPKAKPYGNWESMGLDGHTAGHYLTAMAQALAITGDEKIRKRLQYTLDELEHCQNASTDGFLGGTPGSKALWADLEKAAFTSGNGLKGTWVPWYNQHKMFAGLRDVWQLTGNQKAKTMFLKVSDWCCKVIANLTEDQMNRMLTEEYGGMNEVLADAYALTGNQKYLDAARRFSQRSLLEPLMRGEDKLTGLHANTQIPKVIGYERIGELTHDSTWINAAAFFWENVATQRSISIGGNSVSEHFNPTIDFSGMLRSKEGPESCNTYNMLKLSRMLWQHTGDARYLAFYERAMFNHILSTEHPHGGFVYFTPIRPRHYRVYSKSQESFWCCVGTGLENHTKYGELLYARQDGDLLVNLYVPSQLRWQEKGLVLTQTGDLSKTEQVVFRTELRKPQRLGIRFRVPEWTEGAKLVLKVNGVKVKSIEITGNYLTVERVWKTGDRVELFLPMKLEASVLPDKSHWTSFQFGPWVLGAETDTTQLTGLYADGSRMGHVANGPLLPIDQAPCFISETTDPASLLVRKGQTTSFTVTEKVYPSSFKSLVLKPFYQIHDARYMLYWNIVSPKEYAANQEKNRLEEAGRVALDARTLDRITPGEQQPEKDHNLKFENSQTGIYNDRHWRHAAGWFSYELRKPQTPNAVLMLTFSGDDVNRRFAIYINDELLTRVQLDDQHRGVFYNRLFELPAALVEKSTGTVLTVRFQAIEGSIAGGLYDVRLLKNEN